MVGRERYQAQFSAETRDEYYYKQAEAIGITPNRLRHVPSQ